MAVLRDFTRIYILEPFARWKLTRDWERTRRRKPEANGISNGVTNGSALAQNGHAQHASKQDAPLAMTKKEARKLHRNVLRFAEQGWSAIYYSTQFLYGMVSISGRFSRVSDWSSHV